ncbi:acyltransferase [Agromyces sp. H3Y2-19a]|uniref:acyltransferase family protein n=1 Tax=Agromyces TaxID=33877 RepID=UPI0023B90541|nr:acyltransferase [Agromyces chromiiresistens]MDF0513089.1 acyltransferase [Agromyces chromiiresistens]
MTATPRSSPAARSGAPAPTVTATAERADAARAAALASRDLVVDLARVGCILLVVVIHLLMIGVGYAPDGALVVSRPLEAQPWFAAATWVGQIMPLFFAVGGFTALAAWRSLARRGGDATAFVRGRVLRLAGPSLPLFAFFAVVLGGATLAGVDPALLDTVATGAGSPLWFLAAFLIAQSAVPWMTRLHARAPRTTLGVLAAGAVAVDALRIASGVTEIGLLNLLFVWLFVQQLGFWYADGWFRRRRVVTLVGLAAAAYLVIWPLVAAGWYSPDMLVNLNPPTVPLMLLGVAQLSLLSALHRPLDALMRRRPAQAVVYLVGSRAMTVYLWHLPVIVVVEGLSLLVPGAAPEPGSAAWWLTRPIMFVVVLAVVFAIAPLLVRFERMPTAIPAGRTAPSPKVTAVATLLAIVPPFLVMQWFLDLQIAVVGTVLVALALVLLRPRGIRGATPATARDRRRPV